MAASTQARAAEAARLAEEAERRAAELERGFLVSPRVASDLGYRVAWTIRLVGTPMILSEEGDSVFLLEPGNNVSRRLIESGQELWRVPVGQPIDQFNGIIAVPDQGQVFVVGSSDLHVLESETGLQNEKKSLTKIANTPPVRYGSFLIYGTRNGQLAWYSWAVRSLSSAYQIADTMELPPVLTDEAIAAVGSDGEVFVLDPATASARWSRRMISEVVAPPAIGEGAIFVAGTDQHIRAFDLMNGTALWWNMTSAPLTSSPVLLDDQLYVLVPGEGLRAYTPRPYDKIDGEIRWTSKDVTGQVITKRSNELIAWDPQRRVVQRIEPGRGALIAEQSLPGVVRLGATSLDNGAIYAIGANGELLRLVPRN